MSLQFKIEFSRYRKGETRISNPAWLYAESFESAAEFARHYLAGASHADPESHYAIHSIEQFGVCAVRCDGADRWETRQEFEARVSAEGEA